MSVEAGLSLVAEVVDAMRRGHTDATLATELATTLARWFPLRAVELARWGGGSTVEAVSVRSEPDAEPTRGTRQLARSHAARALAEQRCLWIPTLAGDSSRDARTLRAAGATRLAVLPLTGRDAVVGFVSFALGPAGRREVTPTPELLAALATVIGTAMHQVDTLAKVAALSRRAHHEGKELVAEITGIRPGTVVAVDPTMRVIFDEVVPSVARHDTTVLVMGETGSGKEVLARRIHQLSPRARRPLAKVNCGAIPESLADSVLFGHERGAFTGAATRHLGLFERAHRGTLFLDEVGELSPPTQVRLLRALQEGEIERVGGTVPIRVDVRVIAATHRDLEEMVARGGFRGDLYYRLHVFPIAVPPLRDRKGDLEPLVETIVRAICARFGRAVPRVTPEVMGRLAAHDWPGNVRELENVIERSLVTSRAELVLPADFGRRRPPGTSTVRPLVALETYRESERRCIQAALTSTGGRIYGPGGAAAALRLKPTTLHSKMKRLGISRNSNAS